MKTSQYHHHQCNEIEISKNANRNSRSGNTKGFKQEGKTMKHLLNFMLKRGYFASVLVQVLLLTQVHAQGYLVLPDGQRIAFKDSGPSMYRMITENGELKSFQMEDPEEIIPVIVTFKGAPLRAGRGKYSVSSQAQLEAEHASFRAELEGLRRKLQTKVGFTCRYEITHEYYLAINGVALRTNRGFIRIPPVTADGSPCEPGPGSKGSSGAQRASDPGRLGAESTGIKGGRSFSWSS